MYLYVDLLVKYELLNGSQRILKPLDGHKIFQDHPS